MADDGFRYAPINFDEPKPWANEEGTMYCVMIVFLTLAFICVTVRFYVRFRLVRAPGWDDLFVGLGFFTSLVSSVAMCMAIQYGLGQHILKLEAAQIGGYLLMFYVGNASYVCATTFIKLALLLQFLRSYAAWPRMRRVIQASLIFTGLWGFSYAFIAWFPCLPIHKFWYGDAIEEGHCWGFGAFYPDPFVATFVSQSAINMALDVVVLLLAVPLYFNEPRGSAGRLRLAGLLSMGCIVIAIAAWRMQTLIEHQAATWPTRDPTWYGPISILLSVIEVDLSCVCASIPIFWPMMEESWNRIFVTQEVKVTREERAAEDDEDGLTHSAAHSRNGSGSELRTVGVTGTGKEGYHRDSFVLRQIDPLRAAVGSEGAYAKTECRNGDDPRKWVKI